ncbi:MAG: hypothetical protein Q9170_004198 [Blastenia crenularia]
MDSPDRMSWTPSSSAKKRKHDETVDDSIPIRIPGAYPPSPAARGIFERKLSPTPAPRFARPGLSPQIISPMHDIPNIPASLRRLYQMVATAGNTAQAVSSSAINLLPRPSGRFLQCIQNHAGPLYAAAETIGNTAKRIKLTIRRQDVGAPSATQPTPQPSTPPRRISQCVDRVPTPAYPTQSSILRNTRETGLRKVRKTLRWLEDQQVMNDASHDMINHQTGQFPTAYDYRTANRMTENVDDAREPLVYRHPEACDQGYPDAYLSPIQDRPSAQVPGQPPFVPLMSGALPYAEDVSQEPSVTTHIGQIDSSDDSYDSDDMLDGQVYGPTDSPSSSECADSVTSSLLEGLDEEDLQGVETREEKLIRKKQEARVAREAAAASLTKKPNSNVLSEQLRAISYTAPVSEPPKKNVVFYDSPSSGHPITLVKQYGSKDGLTPPIKPHSNALATPARPSIKDYTKSLVPRTSSRRVRDSLRGRRSLANGPPVTPENIEKVLSGLDVSGRHDSTRKDQIAAENQIKREIVAAREAEKAERKAIEESEERTRLGTRRMPTGPVIQPLTPAWEDEVTRAMQTGLSSQRELARTSAGESIRRRDFGHVLPQSGIDPPAGWLNDTIITAYLQAIVDYGQKTRGVRRGALPKVHAFNTFFYKNLSEKGYDGVRRWATRARFGGKDLLNMEKIFVPINKGGNHWVLAHINPQSKTIEYFDSFHGSAGPVFDHLNVWLRNELRDAFVEAEWTFLQGQGPVQRNMSDCGVFCATTAKMIVLGVDPMAFSAADMPTQRRRMLAELMHGGFDGEFTPTIVF